jgi:predicted small integral membrane protein
LENNTLNKLTTSQAIKISKASIMLFISFFGILMMYSNVTDYATNYEYLAHILSMDTTRDGHKYAHRAINSPMMHHRIYWLIITLEVMFTVFCTMGTIQLFKNMNTNATAFHEAKKFAIIGLLIALFLYYVCFQVIGIEWFNMDESLQWSYKDWARHIVGFILPALIYLAIRIEN